MPNRYDYLSRAIQSTTQQMEQRKQRNLAELQAIYQDIVGEKRYQEGMGLEKRKTEAAIKQDEARTGMAREQLGLARTGQEAEIADRQLVRKREAINAVMAAAERGIPAETILPLYPDVQMTPEDIVAMNTAIEQQRVARQKTDIGLAAEQAGAVAGATLKAQEPYAISAENREEAKQRRMMEFNNQQILGLKRALVAEGFETTPQKQNALNFLMSQVQSGAQITDESAALLSGELGLEPAVVKEVANSVADVIKKNNALEESRTRAQINLANAQASAAGASKGEAQYRQYAAIEQRSVEAAQTRASERFNSIANMIGAKISPDGRSVTITDPATGQSTIVSFDSILQAEMDNVYKNMSPAVKEAIYGDPNYNPYAGSGMSALQDGELPDGMSFEVTGKGATAEDKSRWSEFEKRSDAELRKNKGKSAKGSQTGTWRPNRPADERPFTGGY